MFILCKCKFLLSVHSKCCVNNSMWCVCVLECSVCSSVVNWIEIYMYIFIDSYVYIDTLLTDDDRSIHFTNLSFTDKYDFIAECVHSVCVCAGVLYHLHICNFHSYSMQCFFRWAIIIVLLRLFSFVFYWFCPRCLCVTDRLFSVFKTREKKHRRQNDKVPY